MENEAKVPDWLKPNVGGSTYFECTDELLGLFGEIEGYEHGDSAWMRLPEWMAWRAKVAKTLGLVEPKE